MIKSSKTPDQPIGRGSATEQQPNTSDRFRFWIRFRGRVNPFDIVAAEQQEESETYGLVTNVHHLTDAPGHLSNFISNDFGESLVEEPQTPRQGTNVAEAVVLANNRDIYMPVQNEQPVYFADEERIHRALGIETIPSDRRIPAGLIKMSNGTEAVAYLDRDFLLGPEAGHLNISGISGLATKTSYAMFLIQSILQQQGSERLAVILLNVKFDDLLWLHESRRVLPAERGAWTRLGLKPEPLPADRVHYLLPYSGTGHRANSYASVDELQQARLYAYDLAHTADKLDLLLADIPDPSDTLASLVGEIANGIASEEKVWQQVRTWESLLSGPPLVQQGIPQKFRSIQANSVGRFLRLLRRIVKTRQSGLFVNQLASHISTVAEAAGEIKAGHTYVFDIARLNSEEQTLVFGDVLRTVYSLYSGEISPSETYQPPEKVIIFVDELNKYAPARGDQARSPILAQVLDIAERGRSFGIILFSAEQFLSAVHPRVTGNSATKIIGRSDSAEINEANYRFLDKDVRSHLTRLVKGELILSHPIYRQPVKVAFPEPAYRKGRERS
jgi:DNA helicase HerA-like ATPase